MHQLWQWHLAATALGRPEAYLNRITEVAKDVVLGEPLSKKAETAMTQDFNCFAKIHNPKSLAARNTQVGAEI
jgi:hypothetical protein